MALFKVMKGGKDRLDSQETRDGYAYFTTEDNGFYIDANPVNSTTGQSEGTVTRRRVNDAANTSIAIEGLTSTTVDAAIEEVHNKTVGLSYDAVNEKLTLNHAALIVNNEEVIDNDNTGDSTGNNN
jgi:hypothetical protein